MAVTQIADVIVPANFTSYIVQNTMEKTALAESGVAVRNGVIIDNLTAGSKLFTVPNWFDLGNTEADVVSDDPAVNSTPQKVNSGKQDIRLSYLHASWSAMNLASELSGDSAMERIQARAVAYWDRQFQRRLMSSLNGILADNVANDAGDMVKDISGLTGGNEKFSASAVIDAAGTLGDSMRDLVAIAMHSDTYKLALKNDLIDTVQQSDGGFFQTFRGLAVIVDDGMPASAGTYTTVLFGRGAVGYGISPPRIAEGTEIEGKPSAGNGGGQQILHSRINLAIHPAGFTWKDTSVAAISPTIAELAIATNWDRVFERKAIPLAFLKHKL